ncbi:MAG: peptidylprolyl isomerase [Anaerolineae bacterium]|nr:peptidylprolyl isomerase [Anaerolineae bacterium]
MRGFQKQWVLLVIGVAALLVVACGGDSAPAADTASAQSLPADSNGGPAVAQAQATPTTEPLAATVNGQPITMAAFARERARRAFGMTVEPATADVFDANVLQAMIDQMLLEQAAADLGIEVTDAEVDTEIAIQVDIATQNGQSLGEVIAAQLYTMDEYREALRGMMLAGKLSQVVADVSPYAPQVHSRHILVTDENTARQLLAQLEQGADFAQLAAQYSLDGSTAPSGGDLAWVSRGDLLQPEVEDVIFALEPGTRYPEPVRSSLGYHIIEVLERAEDRPLSQAALAEKKQQAFLTWLQEQRDTADIVRYVGTNSQ